MKKILLLVASAVFVSNAYSVCNVNPLKFTSQTGGTNQNWINSEHKYSLNLQKFTGITTSDGRFASAVDNSYSPNNFPNSNIVATEFVINTIGGLNAQENASTSVVFGSKENANTLNGVWLMHSRNSNTNTFDLMVIPMGTLIGPSNTYTQNLNNLNSFRLGVYINKQTKQIGLIVNGQNQGYLWNINGSYQNLEFALISEYKNFLSDSSNLGKEISIEVISDHSSLQYAYPTGTTDICGNTI